MKDRKTFAVTYEEVIRNDLISHVVADNEEHAIEIVKGDDPDIHIWSCIEEDEEEIA